MLVRFEAQGDRYRRIITFPDDSSVSESNISFPLKWHTPEPYLLIRPLHEYERADLVEEGKAIAATLLGSEGMRFLVEMATSDPMQIVIQEDCQLPEVARVPWELAFVDGRFLATDHYTPIVRRPSHIKPVARLTLHTPLRMALFSAAPNDQQSLMVEDELFTIALSLDEAMSSGKLVVDEIMNCTREKLKEALRNREYDIVYYTGHGAFLEDAGYLCLEKQDGTTDLMSADDFAKELRVQRNLGMLFLNCCNAASVGSARTESWEGFGDVARKAMKRGAPQVIATQAAIFDSTGRKVMKSFFTELCRSDDFDVAAALAMARSDVENDHSQFHDFYHFVHLSLLERGAVREVRNSPQDEIGLGDLRGRIVSHTANRMDLDNNFIGRFSFISRVEDAWWNDGVKVVAIHGLGGIGKTFLCGRMEQRALTHHIPAKRLNKSIWIDFRDGTGSTLSGILQQLEGIARDFGFPAFNKVLDDFEAFPTPLEKMGIWFDHVDKGCQGKALLILDNLESALNEEGKFRDPEMRAWFVELLVRSPGWKLLITCRHRFNLFPDGRNLVFPYWLHLTEMGITERLALMNRKTELRACTESEKREILEIAGGHPYIINLVAENLGTHPELAPALRKAVKKTAEYAQLDIFLDLLTPEELDWLLIAALCPVPKQKTLIVMAREARDGGDNDSPEASYDQAMRKLAELSLIDNGADGVQVHPLLAWQLLENDSSKYGQSTETIDITLRAIALVYLNIARKQSRPNKAMLLLQGVEAALVQSDKKLLEAYLQGCAGAFLAFVPASIFSDIVRRAEARLLSEVDETSFYTLGFCAQTLCEMHHFKVAAEIFTKILDSQKLPDAERGKALSALGTVYLMQRDWPQALEIYQQALEWKEKTGQHHELGSTWHQIGMVYEEQRAWKEALESYLKALEWKGKTDQHHQLGNTWHQVGMVYEEQRVWKEALESYHKALEWNEKTGQHHELGGTWHQIGTVYQQQREWQEALESYQKALEWNEKTGQHHELGGTWHQIGIGYQEQRTWKKALESYQKALEWKEKTGQHHELGGTWHQIGRVYEEQENFSEAVNGYLSSLNLLFKTGMEHEAGIVLGSLQRIFPNLSPEEWENLKEALPEELYKIMEEE